VKLCLRYPQWPVDFVSPITTTQVRLRYTFTLKLSMSRSHNNVMSRSGIDNRKLICD